MCVLFHIAVSANPHQLSLHYYNVVQHRPKVVNVEHDISSLISQHPKAEKHTNVKRKTLVPSSLEAFPRPSVKAGLDSNLLLCDLRVFLSFYLQNTPVKDQLPSRWDLSLVFLTRQANIKQCLPNRIQAGPKMVTGQLSLSHQVF